MKEGQQQAVEFDELFTPEYAVKPLVPFIPKDSIIWECAGYNSSITKVFREAGFKVVETHISNDFNFLNDLPNFEFDIIITNPPYSNKNKEKFLAKCYSYNKPFALFLPNEATCGVERNKLYREFGIEILVFNRRTDFTGKDRHWRYTNWYCWKILPEKLVFHDLKKEVLS